MIFLKCSINKKTEPLSVIIFFGFICITADVNFSKKNKL